MGRFPPLPGAGISGALGHVLSGIMVNTTAMTPSHLREGTIVPRLTPAIANALSIARHAAL